jgi:hypothetical protein
LLHYAVHRGNVELTELLLSDPRTIDKDITYPGEQEPLNAFNVAARNGVPLANIFLKHGANAFVAGNRVYDLDFNADIVVQLQHNMMVYGYMYGHISENSNVLGLTDQRFQELRVEVNRLLENPDIINTFAAKIFYQKAPRTVQLDIFTAANMNLLIDKIKDLFANSNLSSINSANKLSALKEYYHFSEDQIKTIKDGLESTNSYVLETLSNILYSFQMDIQGLPQEKAIYPGSLIDMLEAFGSNTDFINKNDKLALYEGVINESISLLKNNEKSAATIKLTNHLLPKVKDMMVEYIAKIIQNISDKEGVQNTNIMVLRYLPQSLANKTFNELKNTIESKFNDVLVKFAKQGYDKTAYGFTIYLIEELCNVAHNNNQYHLMNEILTQYDEHYEPATENAPSTADNINVSTTNTVDDEKINPLLGQEEGDISSIF